MNDDRPTLTDRLGDAVLRLIDAEGLHVGDRLPSVARLAETLGATVPTVREALRRLQTADVVVLRHGSGVYVGPGIQRTVMANPFQTQRTGNDLRRFLEARLALEPPVARLAAINRTTADLDALERNIAPTPAPAAAPRHENFHILLARASGNPVLADVVETLLQLNSKSQRAIRQLSRGRTDEDDHCAILRAVRDADPEAAEERTRTHLERLVALAADPERADAS